MKYKISGPGFIQIDEAGNKSAIFRKEDKPGTMGAGFYKAMIESEIEIEPEFTAEELIDKEIKEEEQSLENQKSTCQLLLDNSDKKLVIDSPYSTADLTKWKTFRTTLRAIIKSDKLEEIPKKPF